MAQKEKYQQVADYIEDFIKQRQLKPGERLPSVRTLMTILGTTRATICRGMQLLAERDVISSNVGSGTFVADPLRVRKAKSRNSNVTIGVMLPAGADSYAINVLNAINNAAEELPVRLKLVCVSNLGTHIIKVAAELLQEGCDALLIPWFPPGNRIELAAFLKISRLPVCLPAALPGFEEYNITIPLPEQMDLSRKTDEVCRYFQILGEKRLVLLGPDICRVPNMRDNVLSFSRFMSANPLECHIRMTGPSARDMDATAAELKRFKGELALICYDDIHALRFMVAMHTLGLSAPADFRIIGANDTPEAVYCEPPLSSVRPDYAQIARIALKAAIARADGKLCQYPGELSRVLVIRDSCAGKEKLSGRICEELRAAGIAVTKGEGPGAFNHVAS